MLLSKSGLALAGLAYAASATDLNTPLWGLSTGQMEGYIGYLSKWNKNYISLSDFSVRA